MRRSLAPLLALVLLALAAAPVGAKEGLQAVLDAPIAMGTPGGTEILVGITVTDGHVPVEGSPMYLKLTGPNGDVTRAAGAADRTPGHYTMRITIPEGGAREIEIGLHGSSDLPIMVMNDPFTFGPITNLTAQGAPPLATPAARPAAPVQAPVTTPATTAEPAPALPAGGLLAAIAIVAVAALAVAIVARRRHAAGPTPRSA